MPGTPKSVTAWLPRLRCHVPATRHRLRALMTHWIRRAAGLALVLLTVVPLFKLLPSRDTGATGRWTAETVSLQTDLLWSGAMVLAIIAVVAGMLVPSTRAARWRATLGALVMRPSRATFAIGAGAVSALVTAVVARAVFESRPNLVDALLQLTHARYFAAGLLGGPPMFADGFWHMQNSLVNASGWYSQYPPGHILLLALGFAVGAAWVVGPVVMGIATALTVVTLARLLPGRETVARVAGAATALSPFLIAHSASFMNHSTAAMLGVLAVYCALRASSSLGWAAVAGATVSGLAAVRPVAAVVTMFVVIFVWLQPVDEDSAGLPARPRAQWFTLQGALAVLGGLPFLAAHLWYNGVAFGGPTVFGYDATWGPSHGLGFHRDPWGNDYGPIEALLYTSADLSALNSSLLETLLPHLTLIGVFLVVARMLTRGERVLVLWSLLPVLANVFYWHHGQFMGPRMLTEFAPAWIGLSMVSLHRLLAIAPDSLRGGMTFAPSSAGTALVFAAAGAFFVMAPQRVWSYGGEWLPGFRVPVPPAPANSIVFVHGAWEQRIMSRLGSQGVRLDRVETAMRQNPTCLVQRHLTTLEAPGTFGAARSGLPALDLEPSATEYLPRMLVARDARVRVDTTTTLDPACVPEVRADRFGAIDASFILWLGDLPGIEEGKPMFARDLGPAMNRRLLARFPGRSAWLYGYFDEGGAPRLVPYAQGESLLWDALPPASGR